MTARVTAIHGVIARVRIAIGANACAGGIKGVGVEEPSEIAIVIARIEIFEAGFSIIALVDIALGIEHHRPIRRERLAKRAIIMFAGHLTARHIAHHAVGTETVFVCPRSDKPHTLYISAQIA